MWGDGGYQGQGEVIREVAPMAQDMTCRRTKFKHRVDEFTTEQEPHQVESESQGGTRVSSYEAAIRLRPGEIPRAEEERQPDVCLLRAGQPVYRAQTVGPCAGVVCPEAAPAVPSG